MTSSGGVIVLNINPEAKTRTGTRALVRAMARLTNRAVRERHYLRVTDDELADAEAIVVGPQGVPFNAYPDRDLNHLFKLLRTLEGPALCVCGGHQALVLAYGGELAPVHGGVARGTYEGLKKETGLRRITATGPCELLTGSADFVVSHIEGVSLLPEAIELLATGDPCRIQMVKVLGKAIYGVQFHPEKGGDGHQLLKRFVAIAGLE